MDFPLIVTVFPALLVLLRTAVWLAEDVPTIWLAKVRLAGNKVTVRLAGTVTVISLDLGDSLAVCQAPPPVPVPLVEEAKVKLDELGCPVEDVVVLNAATLFPPMATSALVGKAQLVVQVTVATDPLPDMLVMIPPT